MTWHLKLTMISGYDTREPGPQPGIERLKWGRQHWIQHSQRGHLKPEACRRLAKIRGIVGDIKVTWTTSDLNGKGTGGIDRKFSIAEDGTVRDIEVTAEQQREWAAADADDAHETA